MNTELLYKINTPFILEYTNSCRFSNLNYYSISPVLHFDNEDKTYCVYSHPFRVIYLENTLNKNIISELFKKGCNIFINETNTFVNEDKCNRINIIKDLNEIYNTPDGYYFNGIILITNDNKLQKISPQKADRLYWEYKRDKE